MQWKYCIKFIKSCDASLESLPLASKCRTWWKYLSLRFAHICGYSQVDNIVLMFDHFHGIDVFSTAGPNYLPVTTRELYNGIIQSEQFELHPLQKLWLVSVITFMFRSCDVGRSCSARCNKILQMLDCRCTLERMMDFVEIRVDGWLEVSVSQLLHESTYYNMLQLLPHWLHPKLQSLIEWHNYPATMHCQGDGL